MRARSRATSPRSISRATTRPARPASSPVSAPSPGPISTTRSPRAGATRSTIARATPASRRKCWPSARRLVACTPPRLEVGLEGRVHSARLGDRRLAVARVVDDVVRQLRLLRDGHLAPHPLLRRRGAQRVARREALGLRRRVRDDHDEAIHGRGVPALDHHGGVEDHEAGEVARLELGERPRKPLPDPRVGDRLEALLRRSRREEAPRGDHPPADPGAAKTIAPSFWRSSSPSGRRIPRPNVATISSYAGSPGTTTSRASTSASMITDPSRRKTSATVDLPVAMPPVSPTRRNLRVIPPPSPRPTSRRRRGGSGAAAPIP